VSASLPALQPPDERRIDFQAPGELLLRDPGLVAQRAKRSTEDELILLGGEFDSTLHTGEPLGAWRSAPGYLWSDCRGSIAGLLKVPPRCRHSRGRGTERRNLPMHADRSDCRSSAEDMQ